MRENGLRIIVLGVGQGVKISKKGLDFLYFLPFQAGFSVDKGTPYFVFGVKLMRKGLQEAIKEESKSGREIDNTEYLTQREIFENGEYTRVSFRIKRFPDNLEDLFNELLGYGMRPFARCVDKIRYIESKFS